MGQAALLAIDQGTTSSRALVFSPAGELIASAQNEFPQHYPANGWVEHDPEDIWQSVLRVTRSAMLDARAKGWEVQSAGITNQRETVIVWERSSGAAIYPAIVWQDRRTAAACEALRAEGLEPELTEKTGLLLDPYFSASKIAWILDHVPGARQRAAKGELAAGTVDSFLIWRMNQGGRHQTDATNASRTSLYDIRRGEYCDRLLAAFNVPRELLPSVHNCADDYGQLHQDLFGKAIPLGGIAGDQQAATIGQGCTSPGTIKSTYGTGCFVLLNTGSQQIHSSQRLLSTVAYQLAGQPVYGLEGSIFVAGAAVQWLRDQLGVISQADQTEALAAELNGNDGVYLVPAFTGLGAPHWDPEARGSLLGMTRNTGRAHLARAALESVAYQTADLLDAMGRDGQEGDLLRVDGGMVRNSWLCQFLADVLDRPVERPELLESTALGAAWLAGLAGGVYSDLSALNQLERPRRRFEPRMTDSLRGELLEGWRAALRRTRSQEGP
ncbi:MAG: glycerol kinase GlpK [Pseudomonadota bacterium]